MLLTNFMVALPEYATWRSQMMASLGAREGKFRGDQFLWKPYIILHELERLPEGGYVVYSDVTRPGYMALRGQTGSNESGGFFRHSLRPLIDWLERRRDQFVYGLPGV